MTLKEMAAKVEAYNEIAVLIGNRKVHIYFSEYFLSGEKFESYTELRKFIRREYIKEVADMILKSDEFIPCGDPVRIERVDAFGDRNVIEVRAEINEGRF